MADGYYVVKEGIVIDFGLDIVHDESLRGELIRFVEYISENLDEFFVCGQLEVALVNFEEDILLLCFLNHEKIQELGTRSWKVNLLAESFLAGSLLINI